MPTPPSLEVQKILHQYFLLLLQANLLSNIYKLAFAVIVKSFITAAAEKMKK
jgi:hypothetical protein